MMIDDNCVELQRKITKLEQQLQSDKQRHAADLAAQEELIRHEKLALLAQVADIVGHELRNPLGVINNAVYFLQTVLAEADATVKEYLGIINGEIAEAERIVSDLLDAVRTKPPQTDIVDVAALIAQTLPRCQIPADVDVRQHIPETLSAIRVDPAQMQQVLWNLVTNAVEAMPQGGLLEITASEDKQAHSVRIDIHDSGAGIAPEQQNRLFQPLFTTKTRRIGLGLAVVKNLTQANGGKVAVNSESGKGATFTIILPAGSE
ncbi:MAG: ATP-binding protein [Sulfuriferula sp.]|nr:ATP-binding protein [Sulfuriferula sp.]